MVVLNEDFVCSDEGFGLDRRSSERKWSRSMIKVY